MQYRKLGRSGLNVSSICLGTMMFGGPTDEATSARIVAKARAVGINFIDTADNYNKGVSEEVVGRAISKDRLSWVLATKLANAMGEDPNRGGLSRRWVLQAADDSLKRLGAEYIDIYYLHKEDHATPLEETVRAMGDLTRQGKIRYFGISNYRGWRIAEICNICDRLGIDRPVVSQPTACPRSSTSRPATITASVSCRTARSRAAYSPANMPPLARPARTRGQGATTRA
jgi:aryl-alcohol dehydrogenase-like predicted oxidoreductase